MIPALGDPKDRAARLRELIAQRVTKHEEETGHRCFLEPVFMQWRCGHCSWSESRGLAPLLKTEA